MLRGRKPFAPGYRRSRVRQTGSMPQSRRLQALLLVLGCGGEVHARGGNASAPGVDGDGATGSFGRGRFPALSPRLRRSIAALAGGSGEREPELCP